MMMRKNGMKNISLIKTLLCFVGNLFPSPTDVPSNRERDHHSLDVPKLIQLLYPSSSPLKYIINFLRWISQTAQYSSTSTSTSTTPTPIKPPH